MLVLKASFTVHAQSAPTIISVTPAAGATGVSTNSTLVFVFDQDMNTSTIPYRSQLGFIGNYDIQPTNVLNVSGAWTNSRTLRLTPSSKGWPYTSNIVWTINPSTNGGTLLFPQFAGTNGVVVAAISGSFTVTNAPPPPPPVPKLLSVTPTNNAVEVPPDSAVVFIFDQDMDTTVPLIASTQSFAGNFSFSHSVTFLPFTGFWGSDKRTLTFQSVGLLSTNTGVVLWKLNPTGVAAPLKSALGVALAATNGSFTVITNTGGDPAEGCQTIPAGFGTYSLTKTFAYRQTSTSNVVADMPAASLISFLADPALVKNDPAMITGGSLTLPNTTVIVFTNEFVMETNRGGMDTNIPYGNLGLFDSQNSAVPIEGAYAPGDYTLRIDTLGETEAVVSMSLPATPASVPMVSNYDQLLGVDPAQALTLNWNPFSPQGAGAFVKLIILDQFGKPVFVAPNSCLPRSLDPTATSITIPASTFRPGVTYNGALQFGLDFYDSTNDVIRMAGNGSVLRTTSFNLKMLGGTGAIGAVLPALFTSALLVNGHPEMTIHGAAGQNYSIRRTGNLANPSWTVVGSVATDSSGNGIFDDLNGPVPSPVFYEVIGGN